MSRKTKLILQVSAILLVVIAVGMHFKFIIIPVVGVYKFWITVVGFVLLLMANA